MFDLSLETPIPLAAAVKLVPPARSGKRCHLSTLLRWIMRGCKAPDGSLVKLEAIRLGNRWMTSRQALQRFAERLTPRTDSSSAPAPRTAVYRRRASERAAADLERMGL
jgi:hypothetical protein